MFNNTVSQEDYLKKICFKKKATRGNYLLQFGFDKNRPTDVRIGYAELICNDFKLLDTLNTIRRITETSVL
jgi:hypothetical protein